MDRTIDLISPALHQLDEAAKAKISAADLLTKPAKTLTFDDGSDLSLIAGKELYVQVMFVDSRALCRASPVFRKMLRGSFVEQQPKNGENWVVKLPADNPEAIAVLCDLCHGLMSRALKIPPLQSLYEIVVAADKYDMIRCLRPVAKRWLKFYSRNILDTSVEQWSRSLLVAWNLGYVKLTIEAMSKIANQTHLDPAGGLVYGPDSIPAESYAEALPFEMINLFKEQRSAKLNAMLGHC